MVNGVRSGGFYVLLKAATDAAEAFKLLHPAKFYMKTWWASPEGSAVWGDQTVMPPPQKLQELVIASQGTEKKVRYYYEGKN